MTEQSDRIADLRARLDGAIEHKDRLTLGLTVAAAVAEGLRRLGRTAYVVGGFAVEAYSGGSYTTSDIDFAASATPEEIAAVMTGLGFRRVASGCWMRDDLHLVVDFPGSVDPGEWQRIVRIKIGDQTAYVLSVEDIILDRLMAARHWKDEASAEWARRLMITHHGRIAWDVLAEQAEIEGCADLLTDLRRQAEESLRQIGPSS